MNILVTGGAGMIGSVLVRRLVERGDQVVVIDDLSTGRMSNLDDVDCRAFVRDVADPLPDLGPFGWFDAVAHLASPASPADFADRAIDILQACGPGTLNALDFARRHDARLVLASTSEVYGDPAILPIPESYRGAVSPTGPRSAYDEGKRYAEAATMVYHRTYGLNVGIARIFNTYGPSARTDDGRIVPAFLTAALTGRPLEIHGSGFQTRSLCYVDDTVDALVRLLDADEVTGPVNVGHPVERTVNEIAQAVLDVTGSRSPIRRLPVRTDDPINRCPDITAARTVLGWEPTVELRAGLERTAAAFRRRLHDESVNTPRSEDAPTP